ncbi:MAG TPA: TolC family protein [bacterium]
MISYAILILMSQALHDTVRFDRGDAIEYALLNNPEIIQLQIDIDKAEAGIGEARSSFYPTLSLSGYYAYITDVSVFMMDSIPIPIGQHENYDLQVSLQQVLFTWGKVYNAYRIAGLSRDIAFMSLDRKKQEVTYSVTTAFDGLLVLEEMVKLMRESLDQLQRHEEAVQKRYAAGLVSQFELLRAGVQVANFKPTVIQTENGLNLAREGFKMLLGLPLDRECVVDGELQYTEQAYDLEELTTAALASRAEIKNLQSVEKIALAGRSIAQTANLPSIVAGATYDRQKPFGLGGSEWGSNMTFSLGFQLPLFSGFKSLYAYKSAALKLKEARHARENLEKAISLEVKQSYLNFLASQEALSAAQENVNQATRAFEIMETRYKSGLATNLEFMDAQLAATQAKTNYLNTLKEYHAASAGIRKATGKE